MLRLYPSLIDKYSEWLRADDTWEKFWGNSETPKVTPEEFRTKQLISFLDSVNRVPYESDAATRGTCFNELIDCMLKGSTQSSIMEIEKNDELYHCKHLASGREFDFHPGIVKTLYKRYRGAQPQVLVEAPINVGGEEVLLYGYIDELMPFAIHDIKTTGKWELNKFRHHAQHLVYTYCVRHLGSDCDQFHYDIVQWGKEPGKEEFNIESYMWTHESYAQLYELVSGCVSLLGYLKPLITDKRVFGGVNDKDYCPCAVEKLLIAPSDEGRELYKELFNINLI